MKKNHRNLGNALLLSIAALSLNSCEFKAGGTSDGTALGTAFSQGDPTAAATATANGAATLTAADLVGTWDSACLPFTPTYAGSGTAFRQYHLVISEDPYNYNLDENWWRNSGCNANNYVMQIGTNGTFTIGSLISGSLFHIQFLPHNGTFLYPFSEGKGSTATWLTATGSGGGNGCPNAGPYTDGQSTTVGAIGCNFSEMVALGSSVNNVVELSGSTLSFGAESVDYSSLGVPANETTPTTVTVDLIKQ